MSTRSGRIKEPCLGGQVKYLSPEILPSFFPTGSSFSIPVAKRELALVTEYYLLKSASGCTLWIDRGKRYNGYASTTYLVGGTRNIVSVPLKGLWEMVLEKFGCQGCDRQEK